jgi:hypothetical protein
MKLTPWLEDETFSPFTFASPKKSGNESPN